MVDGDSEIHWCVRFDLAANEPTMLLLQLRLGIGSNVKHVMETLRPGQNFGGVSFEGMAAQGSGWLVAQNGQFVICEISDGGEP